MAAEGLDEMNVITRLSNQALEEYESLHRRHEATTMECRRLEEERDQAIKQLNEIQQESKTPASLDPVGKFSAGHLL